MRPVETVQRVAIWSGRLRLSHWLSAVAVLVLLLTGWLMTWTSERQALMRDLHFVAGYALLLALALRAWLLVSGEAAEHWRDLIPRGPQRLAAWHTARFYFSLGRAPLPAWYAHNPLWGPLYLLWWLVLLAQLFTGLAPGAAAALGLSPGAWHSLLAQAIAILVAAHVAAVFLHDLKGGGADVSAMINGHRCFRSQRGSPTVRTEQEVSLDALLRRGSDANQKDNR